MIKEQIKQFFATKKSEPNKIHMGGNSIKLKNLPTEERDKIMRRLAEKDEIMAKGLAGELPGIIIDGKKVTKDNIKEFEITPSKIKEEPKSEIKEEEEEKVKQTADELKKLNKSQQTEILNKLGVTKIPLLEANRINLILELQ
jgi:hypothetical protein